MDEKLNDGLSVEQQIANDLASLWREYKPTILMQLSVIEQASQAVSDGELTAELRDKARIEAHKLAGSVGSFGLKQGSVLSSNIESIMKAEGDINMQVAQQLSELVEALRRELDRS